MITNTNSIVRYNGIAAAPYEITFAFWDASEIRVTVSKANGDSRQLASTEYAITKSNNVDYVTLVSPQGLSDYAGLTIERSVAAQQLKTFLNGTNISGPQIEQALDKIVALSQQILEKFTRSILSPVSEAGSNLEVPLKAQRGNMLLGFDATGEHIIPVLTTDIEQRLAAALAAEISCIAQASAAAASAAAALASETTANLSAEAAEAYERDAGLHNSQAYGAAAEARLWAVGTDPSPILGDATHNAKHYAESAATSTQAAAASEAAALQSKNNASVSEQAASASAGAAATSEQNASSSAGAALAAKTAAETAQGFAEHAQADAETAQAAAETARTGAETARTGAESAQAAALAAKTAAETAETNAETAETNAETAETNAETAQAAAEAALASVMAMYAGASATPPANPVVGTMWFDTTASRMKTWDGASWFISYNAASNVSYSNTTSGLAATEVQAAIDEVSSDFQSLGLVVINNQICMTEE